MFAFFIVLIVNSRIEQFLAYSDFLCYKYCAADDWAEYSEELFFNLLLPSLKKEGFENYKTVMKGWKATTDKEYAIGNLFAFRLREYKGKISKDAAQKEYEKSCNFGEKYNRKYSIIEIKPLLT